MAGIDRLAEVMGWDNDLDAIERDNLIAAAADAIFKVRGELAALIPNPANPRPQDWPVSNPEDAECLQNAYEAVSR